MKKSAFFIVLLLASLFFLFIIRLEQNPESRLKPSSSATPTVAPNPDQAAIAGLVNKFYLNYDSCLKNPPKEAKGNVSIYCQNNTGFTDASFAANLAKGGVAKAGADPIYCAQNPPESVTVSSNIQMSNELAVALVNEKMGQTQIQVQIDLVKEDRIWKIINVVCPKP